MTIKSILVPLSLADVAATTLKAAIGVAESHKAHIDVLHVRPDLRMLSAIYGQTVSALNAQRAIREAETKAVENTRRIRAAFEAVCKSRAHRYSKTKLGVNGMTIAWHEETGYEDRWLQRYGRLTDLIVVAHPAHGEAAGLSLETALIECGRPVLVTPIHLPVKIGSNIAIAWNDSPEAARAVGEARPFLAGARKVIILTAAEPDREEYDVEGLRRFLACHGVSAKIQKVASRGNMGKALASAAIKHEANLFVMGAYSHSRVRQLIFGGVTHHMLQSATLPILMMH